MGSKKTTLEEAYFHISNGGITFKIVEEAHERESKLYPPSPKTIQVGYDPTPIGIETRHNRRWYFEVRTSCFGAGTTFRFPLGNPVMVAWTIDALKRVFNRMTLDLGKPTDGYEFGFRDNRAAQVNHHDGNKVDFKWPFEEAKNEQSGSNS